MSNDGKTLLNKGHLIRPIAKLAVFRMETCQDTGGHDVQKPIEHTTLNATKSLYISFGELSQELLLSLTSYGIHLYNIGNP